MQCECKSIKSIGLISFKIKSINGFYISYKLLLLLLLSNILLISEFYAYIGALERANKPVGFNDGKIINQKNDVS